MQIFVRTLRGATVTLSVDGVETVEALKLKIAAKEGVPAHVQRVLFAGRQLEDGRMLRDYRVESGSTVQLVLRLRGGISLTIKPCKQKEVVNMWWKQITETDTKLLEPFNVDLEPTATIADVVEAVRLKYGWKKMEDEEDRLEGFTDPWDRVLWRGRNLEMSKTLADLGISDGEELVTVRIILFAEDWKVQEFPSVDEIDYAALDDTDDEDDW